MTKTIQVLLACNPRPHCWRVDQKFKVILGHLRGGEGREGEEEDRGGREKVGRRKRRIVQLERACFDSTRSCILFLIPPKNTD